MNPALAGRPRLPKVCLPGKSRSRFALPAAPFLILLALFLLSPPAAFAQTPATPKIFWLFYSADHPLSSPRWGLHFDGRYRPTAGSSARQWRVPPGVNLSITAGLQLSLTYSYFDTHPNGLERDEDETREHRMHQQLEYSVPWRRIVLRHRFRMEERWISGPRHNGHSPAWRWQDRPRYMLRMDLPVRPNGSLAPVLTLYDEVLFSFASPAASAWEQNRIYSGLTWKLRPGLFFDTGALHQALKSPAGPFRHNVIFLLMLRNNLPLRGLLPLRRGS